MGFTETYHLLNNQWKKSGRDIPTGTGVTMKRQKFPSFQNISEISDTAYLAELRESIPGAKIDEHIRENSEFEYHIFHPSNSRINNGLILLLHGLNERKWDKYLPWAENLASRTGKSVILFPISFHMNRSLPEWTNRHIMMKRALERNHRYSLAKPGATFINGALSERLTEVPERFFLSGLQTANDLISLLLHIYHGHHPLFQKYTRADIFAYSIGGFLAQILFIANPQQLFTSSRMFLFCAGSLFHEMKGVSKFIMDPVAFEKIHLYYTSELEFHIRNSDLFASFFNTSKIGMAFRSMIAPGRLKDYREKRVRERKEDIYAISMKNDRVIPSAGISRALLGSSSSFPSNMREMDFSFPNYHEMPFPLFRDSLKKKVDEAFENIFSTAAAFLAKK